MMGVDGPAIPAHIGDAIDLAEGLVDMTETQLLRLLVACPPVVTEELLGVLRAQGGRPPHTPSPPSRPALRAV